MRSPISASQLKKKLTQEGLVTEEKFEELVAEADRKSQNLVDVLVSQRVIDPYYVNNFIAATLGVELADLSVRAINKEMVQNFPEEIARQRQAIVFNREADGTFDVAMLDPSDLETIGFLTQYLKGKVRPYLATPEDINRGFAIYGYQTAHDAKKEIDEQIQASLREQAKTAEEAAAELPIVAIVDNLLSYAISSRASDIHLEILEDATMIRYRVDGILYEIMRIPKAIHGALVARIKLLAGLKIDEHYKPQDGRFRYQIVSQIVDVRVSVMPTFHGEKIVMRLLEATQKPLSVEELGMLPHDSAIVYRNLEKTYGMILSCGPTGSGKTTSLYALMNVLNKAQVNIVTTEDPVEYNMRYVNQTQINPQAGVTFASSLRAILRQDPNIIMVGEIRDAETAEIAIQASLTGHLLLASLHTNDAPTAIPRLFDLGAQPFLISSVLNVVIAQRLARRVCQSCVYSYPAGPELKEIIAAQFKEIGIVEEEVRVPKVLYRGKGCSSCGSTGFRGRVGLFEVLEITDSIKKLIVDPHFDLRVVQEVGRKNGMRTMFEDGITKVELAVTTIEEVLRVIKD